MRTTIRLDEHLLKEAKAAAMASGRTFTQLVEDALRETLARREALKGRAWVELPTFEGKLNPGVNLDDSAALLELMEADNDPA
jgi:hypothetical protein